MEARNQLKSWCLIAFLVVLNIKLFGQTVSLTSNSKEDSIQIEQSITIANKQHPVDTNSSRVVHGKWINGKVLYSDDGLLKATQLIAGPGTFTTMIQFSYHDKIFKQDLNYKPDFSGYTLNKIHKLPGGKAAYLFLLSRIENLPDYESDWLIDFKRSSFSNDTDFNHIKTAEYVASAFRIEKDSLFEIPFPLTTSQAADTANLENSKSFGFRSDIKHSKRSPKPFLKYDLLTHALKFLDISYKGDDDYDKNPSSFMNIESGAFQYKDTSFVLANDTSYYYPSLQSLSRTIAHGKYKAGKYIIKAVAIKSYQDFGGDIAPVLTTKYEIGAQTLTSVNDDDYDGGNKVDLKPDYKVQNNSSLILLLTDETNGHGPGMCGAASYSDSKFWVINNKSPEHQLFSFSYGSCSPAVTYTFIQNGKDISGNFYLTDKSDNRDGINFEDSYWKNNSTYVFVIGSIETSLARNFYLHFNLQNKKAPITLKAGKLYEAKQSASK